MKQLLLAILSLISATLAADASCFEKGIVVGKSSSGTKKDDSKFLTSDVFDPSARITAIKTCVVNDQLRGI